MVTETIAKPSDRDLELRWVRMSVMVMAMAVWRAMNLPQSDQATVGAAAMLREISEKVRETDGSIRLIVLQTHERAASGFSRRITLPRIHRWARVLRCNPASPLQPIATVEGEQELTDLSRGELDVKNPSDEATLIVGDCHRASSIGFCGGCVTHLCRSAAE